MRTPRRLATLPRVRLAPASFPLMLPTLVEEVPRGPGWLFELKWDGVRVLALREKGRVELWARSGARVTGRRRRRGPRARRRGRGARRRGSAELRATPAPHAPGARRRTRGRRRAGDGVLLRLPGARRAQGGPPRALPGARSGALRRPRRGRGHGVLRGRLQGGPGGRGREAG